MEVYRITHKKWADKLVASGYAGRWNSNGVFVIYTAENRSLCCLENLVHMNGFQNVSEFCVMTIYIPDSLKIIEVKSNKLPDGWNALDENGHMICRKIGDSWALHQQSPVLVLPSAIVPNERNFLINPNHADFSKIKLKKTEPFTFDTRLF